MKDTKKSLELTVEVVNFIAVFCGETKAETLENIHAALPDIEDNDMLTMAEDTIEFLNSLSDEEFDEYNFSELAEI